MISHDDIHTMSKKKVLTNKIIIKPDDFLIFPKNFEILVYKNFGLVKRKKVRK